MLEFAMKIIFCLLIAALLGGIIGYFLGRIKTCDGVKRKKRPPLYDYDEIQQTQHSPHKEVYANIPDATIKKEEKGIKPIALALPKDGIADDLKKISGIGLKIEHALNELGIYHYAQIAEWTGDNVSWIDNYLSYKGRVEREEWITQAKVLSVGGDTPHKKSS